MSSSDLQSNTQISDEVGTYLVRLARKTIYDYFKYNTNFTIPDCKDKVLYQKLGAFVTIETYPEKNLRGCIGYPLPYKELIEAIKDNALNAAFEDPRFQPLQKEELLKIVFEVSVLSKPEEIKYSNPNELVSAINIGKDGLIVRYKHFSGLLLPQVAVEEKLNAEEFLSLTCEKAFLPHDAWKYHNLTWHKFSGTIFAEEKPEGKVIRKKLVN
ncbi:MAG: TIGR00296 family protein [Candidatus Micrarchaeota archaeon]|nr:TIGR00296 family protein [Candidatus Micrarchaeota archaeon]